MLPNEIRRDERGTDRCARIVNTAVPNVTGDPSRGYHNVAALCNKPIVQRISDGVRGCPGCDKEPPVGNVHPKTMNSAGVQLTKKELEECGVTGDDPSRKVVKIAAPKKEKKPVEAKVKKVNKDELVITVSLADLERDSDIAATLLKKASESLDSLPVTNFAESKRLIKLQEKLDGLVRA